MPFNDIELNLSSYVVHGTEFEAPSRYTLLERIGHGAYGIVCSAWDEIKDETVAIKKIENTFEHETFAKRTLRELRILRHLQHENVIDIRYAYLPGMKKETLEDIYVVSELMETDLGSILKSPQALSEDHCQFFMYQIVRGLKYIHSAQVIHRDLKPRNLLVNSNCDVRICDFGLARVAFESEDFRTCPMTEYVCTRWYRAPEVLCSWTHYGKPIDIWSVSCIFAEMLRRKSLFPGRNTQQQLQLIIACLGTPDKDALQKIPNIKCRTFIEALSPIAGIPLEEIVPEASKEAFSLLYQTLKFNPDERLTVEQMLEHPYFFPLHVPEDEPTRAPLESRDFDFEWRDMDIVALREEVFLEVMHYSSCRGDRCDGYPTRIKAVDSCAALLAEVVVH